MAYSCNIKGSCCIIGSDQCAVLICLHLLAWPCRACSLPTRCAPRAANLMTLTLLTCWGTPWCVGRQPKREHAHGRANKGKSSVWDLQLCSTSRPIGGTQQCIGKKTRERFLQLCQHMVVTSLTARPSAPGPCSCFVNGRIGHHYALFLFVWAAMGPETWSALPMSCAVLLHAALYPVCASSCFWWVDMRKPPHEGSASPWLFVKCNTLWTPLGCADACWVQRGCVRC